MSKIMDIRQHDLKDCGACCLDCLIRYYNGYVPFEKIREDTCTTSSGTSAFNIIKAAQNYGFDAMGVKTPNIHDSNIYLPAIAHLILKNGLQHFVVIYKITPTYIYIMDPAQGKIKMKVAEFQSLWDNILILFSVQHSNIIHYEKNPNLLILFLNLLMKNKKLNIILLFTSLLLMFFTILSNFYFQVVISSLNNRVDTKFLKFLILVFFIIYLFKVISNFLKNYYLNYLNKNLDVCLYSDFLRHLFNLPLKFMENRSTGEVISRIEELNTVKSLISDVFANFIVNAILIFGAIITLYLLNTQLFFILCIVASIYLLIGLLFSKLIYHKIKENIEVTTDFNNTLIEQLNMFNSIKNLNLTSNFQDKLENKLVIMLKDNFLFQKLLNISEFFKNGSYELGLFLITTIGVYLIAQQKISLLSLVTFNSLLIYLLEPLRSLVDLIPKYNYLKAIFNKLNDFLGVPEEVYHQGLKKISKSSIELKNLNYSYNFHENILHNLTFQINDKDKVFLKGPSGSGKSTLCKLLYRYFDGYEGELNLSGVSTTDFSLNAIRKNILYVGQEENLFSGTIKDNIICYREIPDSEFLKVVKICQIEEIVAKRPNRFNFLLNSSLNNLSGGEKQRIILARALLKKTKILILDEALSEVDIALEKLIINNIITNYADQTLIYVSHKDVTSCFPKIINLGELND